MDFDRLFKLVPKCPITWEHQQVKQWLEFIGLA